MSERRGKKLNRLLESLSDAGLVTSAWLAKQGYSRSLVALYVASNWLESPTRGVYLRKGGKLLWDGVVNTLQLRERLPLHVGGRFALAWQGHEHYLRLGREGPVTLFGSSRLPGWVVKLALVPSLKACGRSPFDFPAADFSSEETFDTLKLQGLERLQVSSNTDPIVMATPERAMLELCDQAIAAADIHEANALMQGLTTLRPSKLTVLLGHCTSIKAKRLFLALADRHAHAWLAQVDQAHVDLGRGKRALVSKGRLHPKYHITLPADLDEQLG